MNDLELTVTRTIAASREKVFNAWLSPAALAGFMRPPGTSSGPSHVSTDAVKGGRFSIMMVTPEKEIPHSGTYLAIDPFHHLSFTWESPHSLGDSVVTIDFEEVEPGTTEITLRHVKFLSEQARDGHIRGWTEILKLLGETVN